MSVFTVTVLFMSIPLVSYALVDRLQVYPALTNAELLKLRDSAATAIVILSAGRRPYAPEFGGETVDNLALERLRYGAEVARRTHLPILVSGGIGVAGDLPHADLMEKVLIHDYGLSPKWQERSSTNTAENAIYSSKLLKRAGLNRVVLVTHAWHMKRAVAAFAANGMIVLPAPTAFYGRGRQGTWAELVPSVAAFRMSAYAVHETLGTIWYSLSYGY
jgi:uncharacterized SAM-binding protein YcdF (DUF218 family)